jgi:uncharacterized delta-60 repeat protein
MIGAVTFSRARTLVSAAWTGRPAVVVLALVGILLVSVTPADAAAGRPGTLDRSFGKGGTVVRGFGTVPGRGGALETAPMPGGGFIVRTSGGSIGRFLADGSLDRGFGEGGYLIGVEATKIATTPDGRIYVLGFGRGVGPQLSRLLPDSSPDPSFGRRGTVGLGEKAPPLEGMLVAPGGAVFLTGTGYEDDHVTADALRVRPDGSLDATYGHHGVARAPYPQGNTNQQFLYALDGERLSFVAGGGQFSKGEFFHRDVLLGRFEPDGDVDPSFDGLIKIRGRTFEEELVGIAAGAGGGVLVVEASGKLLRLSADGALEPEAAIEEPAAKELAQAASFTAFAVGPDGKIVLGGRTFAEGPKRLVLARLDPDGSLDPTFGAGSGVVTTGVEIDEGRPSLTTLADGELLLSGATDGATPLIAATRFTPDGVLDPRFGAAGVLIAQPVAHSDDKVNAIAAGPAGSVLATGTARGRILVADYLADGRPNPGFAGRGLLLTGAAEAAGAEQGTAVVRYPGDRILVATESPAGASLMMLGAEGRPIGSFGRGGTAALVDLDDVSALAVTRTGAILVAGRSRRPCRDLVERLGPRGGVDRSFGSRDGAAPIGSDCRGGKDLDLLQRPGGSLIVAIDNSRTVEELGADGRPSPRFSLTDEASLRLPKHLGAIALDSRGRLLVGGTLFHRLGLVRLDRSGGLDRDFGRGGTVTREVGREAAVTALAVETDGRILAAGIANACPPLSCHGPTALIARFDPAGASDREFGRGGVWTGRRETSAVDSLALGAGGTLFAGGWSTLRRDRNLLLVKVRR